MTALPSNLLVVQLRQIGDVVLTTPIPHIVKAARPGCRVTFLTERPCDQLLQGNPHIDAVLLNDRKGSALDTLRLGWRLRRQGFDAVLDFMGNPRSALLTFLSGAPVRVSYPAPLRGLAYSHRIQPRHQYAVGFKKALLAPLGIGGEQDRPEIYLTAAERDAGQALRGELLAGGYRRLVTVDPSHRRDTRRWPAEHFGDLCRRLAAGLDALPVVLWGPGEEELAREVVGYSGAAARMAPATRLREMAALLAAADLHLGNCSAPRHMAVAVGTPTFTVLGSTDANWTHPAPEHTEIALGLSCQPCSQNHCDRDFACLRELGPEQVYDRLQGWCGEVLGWTLP